MMNGRKTDRELLVEVHGMVSRVDERTEGLPERVIALEIDAAGQRRDVSTLRKLAAGVFTILLGFVAFMTKMFVGDG